jgi:hypothetical protein
MDGWQSKTLASVGFDMATKAEWIDLENMRFKRRSLSIITQELIFFLNLFLASSLPPHPFFPFHRLCPGSSLDMN